MAKVTIIISDDEQKGENTAVGDFRVDYEGAPEGSPPTMAVLFGATLQRLWRSRALASLVPLICGDLMMLRTRSRLPLEVAEPAAPDEEPGVSQPEPATV